MINTFEYLVEKIEYTPTLDLQYYLNQKGLEGWELVNLNVRRNNIYESIFKRVSGEYL